MAIKFGVSPGKEEALLERMATLDIREEDLEESFIRGSGAGGQKINKTSSCVQLIHRPTNIVIRCQKERAQSLNRYLARRELCDKIEAIKLGKESARAREIHKIKKQKKRRSRRSKEKIVAGKRHRAAVKEGRKSPSSRD